MSNEHWEEALTKYWEAQLGRALHGSEVRVIKDSAKWSRVVPKQICQWVGHTLHLAESLADGSKNPDSVSLFWIRLHGLLDEVTRYFKELADILSGTDCGFHARLQKLKSLFSEDEISFIDYYRQTQVHPVQSMLRVKIKKPGDRSTGDPPKIDTTYKGANIDDLEAAIKRLLREAGKRVGVPAHEAEPYVAGDIASRIVKPLRVMYKDMQRWVKE